MNYRITFPSGFSVVETVMGLLIGGVVLGIVLMAYKTYSRSSAQLDELWSRASMAEEFLRNPIDCTASHYGCTGNINLYKTDTSVLVAADGSSRIGGFPLIAKCESGKVRLQYQPDSKEPTKWIDLLPDSLPICAGAP